MKFTVTFKDPDCYIEPPTKTSNAGRELMAKFIQWGEYVTIEFDTETKSVRVLTVEESR